MPAEKGLLKNESYRHIAEEAARIYAEYDSSDPNAYSRMMRNFDRAWEVPETIKEDFEPRLKMRRAAIIKEADEMQRRINASG